MQVGLRFPVTSFQFRVRLSLPLCLSASLILSSCRTLSPEEQTAISRLNDASTIVMNAFAALRNEAQLSGGVCFLQITPLECSIYRDLDESGSIDSSRDRKSVTIPLGLPDRGLQLQCPPWYACDGQGQPAWANPGPSPAPVMLMDRETGAKMELRIAASRMVLEQLVYWPPGGDERR